MPVLKKKGKKIITSKKWNPNRLRVFSRHPTHQSLRQERISVTKPTVVRFGSLTEWPIAKMEINSIQAIKNSSSKLLMKNLFVEAGVTTPQFWTKEQLLADKKLPTKSSFIAKKIYGSRAEGMKKFDTVKELLKFARTSEGYIFEKFVNYSREYRLHVSAMGDCFYACRKMLKSEATDRWYRNDSNSVWIKTTNPLFDIPKTWGNIVEDCIKAMNAVGLDIGACDVKVNKEGQHSIIEINSAPSFGDYTAMFYNLEIKKLIQR